jgi:hypothetical protein
MVETVEQIVREAPGIEAYKLGLLKQAERLADQPVGVLQFDENGQPITETYQYVDAEGNTQTGTRQQRMLPPQLVAEMSGLQTTALANAEAGIGGYKPYLQEAGYTLGDAQTAIGGVMSGALPFQTEAAGLMRTGAANVPGQLQAAQQGIQNALASGQISTEQAQTALAQIGLGGQNIATQSIADQLSAFDQIPGVLSAANTGMGAAALAGGDVAAAARQSGQNVLGALDPQLAASTQAARGMTSATALDALGQAGGAQAGIDAATDAARVQALAGQQGLVAAGLEGQEAAAQGAQAATLAAQQAAADQATAIQGARGITSQAAQALQQAGALGTTAAQQGIAGLAGTTGAFDPASAQGFMNQYEDAAVQQALADVARQGQIAQQGVAAQAVGAGAFGGSRQAVAEQELQRNVLEQQGRTAAQMRQAGFESATQRAQAAFEAQQGRTQQAAQLTGSLGAQGAQAGLSAAQAAGQLGLSGEQLAAQTAQQQAQTGISAAQLAGQLGLQGAGMAQTAAQQGTQFGLTAEQMAQQGALQGGQLGVSAAQTAGQLGLSGEQMASANAQALAQYGVNLESLAAQTGMSAAQLAGQLSGQAGQMGLQGAQTQAGIAQAAGQTGLAGQQLAGQLAGQAGQLGQGIAALGVQGSQQAGALGLQGQELMGRLGEGIGTLGTQYGQLGLQQGDTLGTLGLRQASLGEASQQLGQREQGFLFDLGKTQQAQDQATLDAARASQLQQLYEPYQRVGFLSDIYKGAPSSQQSITGSTAPTASTAQQILGLGVAGLSAAGSASRAGLFG